VIAEEAVAGFQQPNKMVDIHSLRRRPGCTLPVSNAMPARHDSARFHQRQELEIR